MRIKIAHPKRSLLKDITWQDFVKRSVTQELFTWPYLPSGKLKKHEEYDLKKETDDVMKFHDEDWREVGRFVERFSDKQKTVLSWIFAAFISVLGNLAVNLAFALPVFAENLSWMFLCLVIVVALTVTYLEFLPKVSAVLKFIPSYVGFPGGYEQNVKQAPCTNLYSKLIFDFGNLDRLVVDFGGLVRTAVLKDCLCPALKKADYVNISNITQISQDLPAYFIEISTNGVKPWLNPRGREKVRRELRGLIEAMLRARQICSVHRFELDPNEWDIHGCDFVDAVSEWKFEEVRGAIVDLLQSSCKHPE